MRLKRLLPSAGVASAGLIWCWSVRSIDPAAMRDFGLLSVLEPSAFVALAVLAASFVLTLTRREPKLVDLLFHAGAMAAFMHATPAYVYKTLRYSWAWKHVGIVDYINRHGQVDPDISQLTVYHNWPGFFAFNALFARLTGWDALEYANWAPLVFNLLFLGAVVLIARAFTNDARTIGLTAWLFVLSNWIGQDYFGPQALAFFWHLVAMAIVLRWFSGEPRSDGVPYLALAGMLLLLLWGVTSTHQLTPFMALFALTALAAFRRTSLCLSPLVMGLMIAVWMLFGASRYTHTHFAEVFSGFSDIRNTASTALIEYSVASRSRVLVSLMSRVLTMAMLALGLIGGVRSFRARKPYMAAMLLGVSAAGGVMLSSYGGEARLRVFLFSLPFLAFFGAVAVHLPEERPRRGRLSVGATVATGALLPLLLFVYWGNERENYFTPDEIAAAAYVYEVAPPNTLLIEGSRNYPGQFANYEHMTYIPLSRESEDTRREIAEDPVGVLSSWLDNDRFAASYLIITRGQAAEADAAGKFPAAGGLDEIAAELRSSPEFKLVFGNADASVFTLSTSARAGE